MSVTQTFESIAQRAADISHYEQGDYLGEDDLLYCHKCNTPKQSRINILDMERVVPCLCKCAAEARDRAEEERQRQQFLQRCEKYKRVAFPESKMQHWTFANDDMSNEQLTKAMHNYVEHFEEFKGQGKGLLLYGSVGTGKTFAACEVANALLDKGYPVLVTKFTRLANTLQGMFSGRQEYIDSLNRFSLLVLDDLDAERNTEYMQELVWDIVDERYRAQLPMIITTNLTGAKIKNPDSLGKERIYSRLLERCHPIEVNGADRRRAALKDNYAEMKNILGV